MHPIKLQSMERSGVLPRGRKTKKRWASRPLTQLIPRPASYDKENSQLFYGLKASERRFAMSPLFDQSAVTFSKFRELVEKRLKDNVGNPRDPKNPTQRKING